MNTIHHSLELEKPTRIEIVGVQWLDADLILPQDPKGVVLLVHGSGSSRLSPRNRFVARMLREHGLGTMLFDIESLDEQEARSKSKAGSISLSEMARRIVLATRKLQVDPQCSGLPIGYLGAGTGAAAAFIAAAALPEVIRGVVSRGGRVELAMAFLPRVTAPTLLIVGARDTPVVHKNRDALDHLGCHSKGMEVIPGARHLFEEPGTLDAVAAHAGKWLGMHVPLVLEHAPTYAAVQQGS